MHSSTAVASRVAAPLAVAKSDALAIDARGEDTDILALVQPSFDPLQHQRDRFTDVEGSSLLIVVRKRSVEVDANPPVGHGRSPSKRARSWSIVIGDARRCCRSRTPAQRGANGRTCGLALRRCLPGGRPKKRALTRSLRDLAPVREMGSRILLRRRRTGLLAWPGVGNSPDCAARIIRDKQRTVFRNGECRWAAPRRFEERFTLHQPQSGDQQIDCH